MPTARTSAGLEYPPAQPSGRVAANRKPGHHLAPGRWVSALADVIWLTDGLLLADDGDRRWPARPAGRSPSTRGGENVCPAPEPRCERSPDLSFPRSFVCGHCGVDVSLDAPGTSHRNHCPSCLWSRHLDRNVPGDRKAGCPGGMEPIAVTVRGERRWMLIHRCTHCGRLRMNRTAADDNVLLLMQLAALPLATPLLPYPSPATPPGHGARTAQHPA
jgi:hypothetical protein